MSRALTAAFALVLDVSLLAASPAAAQKETPPAGGPPKPFSVPAQDRYELPNGMQVTLVPYGTLPKVTMSLVLRTGNLNEPDDRPGLADLAGRLMSEGTTTRSAQQVAEQAAAMGGAIDIGVGMDETALSSSVLTEFGPAMIRLLADVVRNPRFPEPELPRLKADALRQLTIAQSVPQNIGLERFRRILYGDHRYGTVFPTEASINGTTIAEIREYYSSNFGAARAHLYVAGRFDTEAMKAAVTAGFGDWTRGSPPAPDVPDTKPVPTLNLTDRPGAEQSTLYVGLPVPPPTSPDNIALTVTNALLGGSFGSRITSNIREQKGYTYSPYSQLSRRYHDAYWVEAADVTTAVTGPALKEIFAEIERLQHEAPGDDELKGIETYLSGLFVIQNSSPSALIGQLRYVDLQGLGDDYLRTYVQRVNAITPAEVQRTTKEYIRPDDMTIVVVGDKAKIAGQLTPFARGAN
jgi:zinc protease